MASKLRTGLGTRISFFAFQDIITSVTGILILVTLILALYLDEAAPVTAEQQELKQQLAATLSELALASMDNEVRQTNLLILASAPAAARLQTEIREWQGQLSALSNRLTSLKRTLAEHEQDATKQAERLGLSELRERAGRIQTELDARQHTNAALVAEARELDKERQELQEKIEKANAEHKLWLIPDASPFGKEPVLITVSATNLACERFNQPASKKQFSAATALRDFGDSLSRWRPDKDYLVFYVRPSGIDLLAQCVELAKRGGFQVGYDAVEEDRQIVFSTPAPP